MAKGEETQEDEESPVSGEEASEELSDDEAAAMLIDAEVLIRAGAEKIDQLAAVGFLDATVRDKVDAVWNALLKKIEEVEA